MEIPRIPHVDFPGVEVPDHERAAFTTAIKEFENHRELKVNAAIALVRNGIKPYVRPPAAEIAKRRKTGKAQRAARRIARG